MSVIKSMVDVDEAIGKPISQDGLCVIPISKITVGFLSAGTNEDGSIKIKKSDVGIGGLSGGYSITPQAFVVIDGSTARIMKIEGDTSSKWMEILESLLQSVSKE